MTPVKPKVRVAARYSIGEAADLLGISRNTLRVYARKGKIKFIRRKENGRMVFEGRELLSFWRADV